MVADDDTIADPAEVELGHPGNMRPVGNWMMGGPGGGAAQWESDPADPNSDLMFPLSAVVYDLMSKSDGQVGSILRAVRQPLMRAKWDLDTRGVRPEVVTFVRENLGLPAEGDALPRKRVSKVIWKQHLREALSCLTYGFSAFEQRYEPQMVDGVLRFHLVKLAPRLQRTITSLRVDADGGLVGIVQTGRPGMRQARDVFIPVSQLVLYSREREGADWTGQSLLRTAYKHWLIKDAVLRIAAQIVERNGMGIPIVRYDGSNVTRAQAEGIARQLRAGASAGVALPAQGVDVTIMGVQGSLVDPLPLLKYQDEAMSKAAMTMFLDLGHDNGARSLGDTFVDVLTASLQAEGDFMAETATEHVIRDLVESNWGVDEPYPALTCGDLASQGIITASDLKTLVDAGVVTPDQTLEAHVRKQRGLPEAEPEPEPDQAPTDEQVPPVQPPGEPPLPPEGSDPADPFNLRRRINQPVPDTGERSREYLTANELVADYAESLARRARHLAATPA